MPTIQKLQHKLKQALRLLPALRLVWQAAPGWTIVYIVLIIVQGTLPLLLLYLTKLVIDTVVNSLTIADKVSSGKQLIILLLLTGLVTFVSTICNSFAELVNTAQSQRVTDYMSSIIHAKSIEVDLDYYENSQYHDALKRAQEEASYRPNRILNNLVAVTQNSISLVAMLGLMLSLHWGIASVLFMAAFPSVLVRVKFADIMYRWHRKRTTMERESHYLSWLLTGDIFAKEIRLFDLGILFSQRFDNLRQKLFQENIAISRKRSVATFVAQTIATILMLAAYGFIIYQAFLGVIRIGDLVLYHEGLKRGQDSLTGVLGRLSSLYEDNLFLANLYEFLDIKPQITQPNHPQAFPQPMRTGIVFDNVNFQYSTTTRQALKNINLTIKPGEVIALVGENGSGKTTLIKLLCRLYDPTSGNITIDGIDINNFDITELRRQFSVIFQDYVKYHFTAQENIWLGNVDISPIDDKVTIAARRSGADTVIQSLPQGYDTMLGKWFDQGEELSIGQWQKVALARAFLRNSQVIVLDEPTSAMDPKAEAEVFEGFRQLIKNQAAILISHRLSTVKMADRIYVMDKGRIVESGNHEKLMQMGGSYAYLFETQAKNYR
ncbi:ABC transporter ATP-binding protein [Calothrix sp. PCC 6303]|uniref:ABC transporter ATP-binding protein n=1 Tax=Calothrix sp. PCC 6303 TaxID=1170562 RepID=UPI0002A05390|nr:ABC transporter ATP-binding protein [Calothrix sp. PCC 6303]AFY99919.1 Xenobiotic-transporting ATPase [Calothrix sp. PCC 6303]